jgi:hypothetical protein
MDDETRAYHDVRLTPFPDANERCAYCAHVKIEHTGFGCAHHTPQNDYAQGGTRRWSSPCECVRFVKIAQAQEAHG